MQRAAPPYPIPGRRGLFFCARPIPLATTWAKVPRPCDTIAVCPQHELAAPRIPILNPPRCGLLFAGQRVARRPLLRGRFRGVAMPNNAERHDWLSL